MTSPLEFEDAEPVEASHLVRTHCSQCGAGDVLTTAEIASAGTSACGQCIKARAMAATSIPVVPATGMGQVDLARDDVSPLESWLRGQDKYAPPAGHPAPEYVGAWVPHLTDDASIDPVDSVPILPPQSVLLLAERAREASWDVEMRYSRGTGMHGSTGKPTSLKHMIALRFSGHPMTDHQAVAVYVSPVSRVTWSWESVWVRGKEIGWRGELGVTELTLFLERPDACDFAWFMKIKDRVDAAAAASKARAKLKPCEEGCEVDHAHKAAPKRREQKAGA